METCACDATTRSTGLFVDRLPDGITFSQQVSGAALDSAGDPTWPFYLVQQGTLAPGGSLSYHFGLDSGAGHFLYQGVAALGETVANEDGSTTYHFEGTFDLLSPSAPAAGLPYRGYVSATVGVWSDGTIYTGSFSLTEAAS